MADSLRIYNPATGKLHAEVPAATPDDVAPALARARAAQPKWAALSVRERGRMLRRLAGRQYALGRVLTLSERLHEVEVARSE